MNKVKEGCAAVILRWKSFVACDTAMLNTCHDTCVNTQNIQHRLNLCKWWILLVVINQDSFTVF